MILVIEREGVRTTHRFSEGVRVRQCVRCVSCTSPHLTSPICPYLISSSWGTRLGWQRCTQKNGRQGRYLCFFLITSRTYRLQPASEYSVHFVSSSPRWWAHWYRRCSCSHHCNNELGHEIERGEGRGERRRREGGETEGSEERGEGGEGKGSKEKEGRFLLYEIAVSGMEVLGLLGLLCLLSLEPCPSVLLMRLGVLHHLL